MNEITKMLPTAPVKKQESTELVVGSVFASSAAFELAQRQAKMLAQSDLVPKRFRGQDKIANCVIALDMARQINTHPLTVMRELYIVHGTPGWSSKFLIATVNTCGRYEPMRYKTGGIGDDMFCVAWTTPKGRPDDVLEGPKVDIRMAKAEGWYDRKSRDGDAASKWPTMPQLMLMYRAAAFWVRLNAPELSMGMHTSEELQEMRTVSGEVVERSTQISETAYTKNDQEINDQGGTELNKSNMAAENNQVETPEESSSSPTQPLDPFMKEQQKETGRIPTAEKPLINSDGEYIDVNGIIWDTTKHGESSKTRGPTYNTDGSFRKRRGAAKELTDKEPTEDQNENVVTSQDIISMIASAETIDRCNEIKDLVRTSGFPEDVKKNLTANAERLAVLLSPENSQPSESEAKINEAELIIKIETAGSAEELDQLGVAAKEAGLKENSTIVIFSKISKRRRELSGDIA